MTNDTLQAANNVTNATLQDANYVTNATLSSYVTNTTLQAANYVTNATLSAANYATETWVSSNFPSTGSFGSFTYTGIQITYDDKADTAFTGGTPDILLEEQELPSGLVMRFGHIENCKDHTIITHKKSGWTELTSLFNIQCTGVSNSTNYQAIVVQNLNANQFESIVKDILKDKKPKAGSYRGRVNSEPEKNRQTLLETKNA